MIGDKERNLEQIARAIECGDNCKQEFMKVVGIMMDKIYKLREEKNFYKGECERLRAWSGLGGQSVFSKEKQYAAVCNRKMAEQSLKTSKQKGRAKTKQVDQRVEKPL